MLQEIHCIVLLVTCNGKVDMIIFHFLGKMLLSLSNSSHFAKIPLVKIVLNNKKAHSRFEPFSYVWGTFLECGVGVQLLFGQCPNELRFTVGLPLHKEKLDIFLTN